MTKPHSLADDPWDVCGSCGRRVEITDEMRPAIRWIEFTGGVVSLDCGCGGVNPGVYNLLPSASA